MASASEDTWADLPPLEDVPLPAFPTQALPFWLRAWVEAHAEALQVPRELPALLSLATISTALARLFEVKVRQGWIEPLNIYALVALPSGTRKSVVFEAATAPLVAEELMRSRRRSDAAEDALGHAGEAHLRLVVDGSAPSRAASSARSPSTPVRAPSTQLFVSDATPERVASLLAENGGRAAVLSDEGEICSIIAGRYGGSFEVFLKAHSGQTLAIERQGRPRVHVRRPSLTLGLAVQPDVLAMLARKKNLRERGVLARFLVAVPASNIGYRQIAPPPVPEAVINEYALKFQEMLATADPAADHGEIATLELSNEAHDVFVAFETEVEAMLRPGGRLGASAAWGSKLPGAVARLAGLIHCSSAPGRQGAVVEVEAVQAAIEIARFLIPHQLRAFGLGGTNEVVSDARAIVEWLRREELIETTRREIHQALRRRFPVVTSIDGPLELLVERGFLRELDADVRTGRPSRRFAVHTLVSAGGVDVGGARDG